MQKKKPNYSGRLVFSSWICDQWSFTSFLRNSWATAQVIVFKNKKAAYYYEANNTNEMSSKASQQIRAAAVNNGALEPTLS